MKANLKINVDDYDEASSQIVLQLIAINKIRSGDGVRREEGGGGRRREEEGGGGRRRRREEESRRRLLYEIRYQFSLDHTLCVHCMVFLHQYSHCHHKLQ